MSDAWDEIQAIKSKRSMFREKLEKRKKERLDILGTNTNLPSNTSISNPKLMKTDTNEEKSTTPILKLEPDTNPDIEKNLIQILTDKSLLLPINSKQLLEKVNKIYFKSVTNDVLHYFIQKFAGQSLISIKDVSIGNSFGYEVIQVEHANIASLHGDGETIGYSDDLKRKIDDTDDSDVIEKKFFKTSTNVDNKKQTLKDVSKETSDIMSLLSMPSTREKQSKQVGEEILELLSKPTAKERFLAEKFKSQGGAQVMEFCPHGTKTECLRAQPSYEETNLIDNNDTKLSITTLPITPVQKSEEAQDIEEIVANKSTETVDKTLSKIIECNKLHFKKIIQSHTDESLGDCSFLNTCFHMDTCKYVHYEVDTPQSNTNLSIKNDTDKQTRNNTVQSGSNSTASNASYSNLSTTSNNVQTLTKRTIDPCATLYPPQWIQCDLRYLDMTVLGKFAVVMADPPWDIHMELPYGTMSDDEMRQLGVPALQDDGLIFLWVTGRAMELGRDCLKLWGYERVDELIWVKTNQLQRIIRTGRTGHWLNHGKEHCLVGMKGNPTNLNRGLDCDVIVAEVRATSHKPDEIYGIIERLSPGTRKIELFGRPHNVQPNWITLGNQLDGIRLVDPDLVSQFRKRYPDGNCMAPSQNTKVT